MGQTPSQLTPADIRDLKERTHFSEEEISQFYTKYIKSYPSGRVKKKDLHKFYKEVFPNGDPSNIADQLFRVYDVDNSGEVDFRELLCAVGVLANGDDQERLRLLFKIYDQDQSGYITHKEYHNIVTALYKAAGRLYGSEDESEETVAFEKLDVNNDEKVSFEEFETAAKRDPTVRRLMSLNFLGKQS